MKRVLHTHVALLSLISLVLAAPLLANDTTDPKPRTIKAKAFASGNAGFYTSILGKPFVMTRSRYTGINRRLELNKKQLGDMNADNNYAVQKETMLGYSACIKHERKFAGAHKNAIGEEMREVLIGLGAIVRNTYDENPLVELYEKEVPMYFQMRSADEFATIRQSMAKRLSEKNLEPQKHAVLLVTIENDPTLTSLSEEDQAFIRHWFTQVSFDDGDSRDYFGTMFDDMICENYQLEGARPEYAFETLNENLFRTFEKALGDFNRNKIIQMAATTAGGIILANTLTGPFKDAVKGITKQLNIIDASKKALARTGLTRSDSGGMDIKSIIRGIQERASGK